jgi:ribonuclease HI
LIEVYTDGACRNNQSKNNLGSWGYIINHNGYSNRSGGYEFNTTNQRMEVIAAINSLKELNRLGYNAESIWLYSDSQYVITGINEWINNWIKNGWRNAKKKPIENKDLWVEFLNLKNKFKNIHFEHVDGHANCEGNNEVDRFLNYIMDKAEEAKENHPCN